MSIDGIHWITIVIWFHSRGMVEVAKYRTGCCDKNNASKWYNISHCFGDNYNLQNQRKCIWSISQILQFVYTCWSQNITYFLILYHLDWSNCAHPTFINIYYRKIIFNQNDFHQLPPYSQNTRSLQRRNPVEKKYQ